MTSNNTSNGRVALNWLSCVLTLMMIVITVQQGGDAANINDTTIMQLNNSSDCLKVSRYCELCTSSQCHKCIQNFTLSAQSCQCLSPNVLNIWVFYAVSIDMEYLYANQYAPCVLCTDKFTLDECSPAMFSVSYAASSGAGGVPNITSFVVSFNRNRDIMVKTIPLYVFQKAFMLCLGIDGLQIPIANVTQVKCQYSYCVAFMVNGLDALVSQHYISRGYAIPDSYVVKMRKKLRLYMNGTTPLPQSYRAQLMFKSLRNGYEQDQSYTRYYSGLETINFIMKFPIPAPAPTPTPTPTPTPSNSTSNSTTNSSSSSSPISNSSTNQSQTSASDSSGAKISPRLNNNYGIYHEFTEKQKGLKLMIQIAFVGLSCVGIAGAGASNYLMVVLAFTHILGSAGYYSHTTNITTTQSRLLLFQQIPKIEVQVDPQSSEWVLQGMANFTLVANPAILHEPQQYTSNLILSSYSPNLIFTNLMVLFTAPLLGLFLLYINGYTRSKTNYTHSHIFKTLAERHMVKRVLYMSIRGLYPLIVHNAVIFIKDLYDNWGAIAEGATIQWDVWACLYLAESCAFALMALMMPVWGLWSFSRTDKNNIYIYWRMYGQEQPKEEQKQQVYSQQTSEANLGGKVETKQEMHENSSSKSHSMISQKSSTKQYIKQGSGKQYRQSAKPTIYFLLDYGYNIGSICVAMFVGDQTQSIVLIALAGGMLVLTFYFYVTVGVSKMYAVVRIVEIGLVVGLMVSKLLWTKSVFYCYCSLYLLYAIGVWAIIHVLYCVGSMLYWEIKGLGVHAFFIHKVAPIAANDHIVAHQIGQKNLNNQQVVQVEELDNSKNESSNRQKQKQKHK